MSPRSHARRTARARPRAGDLSCRASCVRGGRRPSSKAFVYSSIKIYLSTKFLRPAAASERIEAVVVALADDFAVTQLDEDGDVGAQAIARSQQAERQQQLPRP